MAELHDSLKLQKIMEEAKTNKVEHAKRWVEEQLRQADGPWDRSSAVVVITALPVLDHEGKWNGDAMIQQALLPDMEWGQLADALDGLSTKIRQHMESIEGQSNDRKPN